MMVKVVNLEKSPELKCPKCGSVKRIESNELKAVRKRVNREADKFKDALGRVGKLCHLPVLEIGHYFVLSITLPA